MTDLKSETTERPASALAALRRAARRLAGAAGQDDLARIDARMKRVEKDLCTSVNLNRKTLKLLAKQSRRLEALLGEKGAERQLRQANLGIQALLRRAFMAPGSVEPPYDLLAQRFRVLSQNEEDGIVWALFQVVGPTTRTFVEIGSGVNGGNSGFLAKECGWSGLMVDAGEDRIAHLSQRFDRSRVRAEAAWVTRETVNDLLARHGLAGEIDLLSIDIDSCDYWVWQALTVASPRVVVIEYNADFGTERAVTVPDAPAFDREASGDKRYYGASLPALVHLGARKGYRLVLVEPTGVNAFFVRNDVGRELPAVVPPTLPPEPSGEEDVFAACARLNLPLVDVDATDPS